MNTPKVPVCLYLGFLSGCLVAGLVGGLTYAAGENVFYAILAALPACAAGFAAAHRVIDDCRCRTKPGAAGSGPGEGG